MSKLATVSVVQCDHCGRVVVLSKDIDWASFSELWHDGYQHDFCQLCREREDVRRIIDTDNLNWQKIVETIELGAAAKKQEAPVEYAN